MERGVVVVEGGGQVGGIPASLPMAARPLSLASFKQLNFNSHNHSQSKNKAHPNASSPLRAMTADIRAQPQQEHNQQATKALRTWWQHFTTSQKLSKPGPLPDKGAHKY